MATLKQHIRKIYRKTPVYQFKVLLEEESRWSRKLTIAQNKLEYVRMKINKFALQQTNINTEKEVDNGKIYSVATETH
jgi:hypothetical protein